MFLNVGALPAFRAARERGRLITRSADRLTAYSPFQAYRCPYGCDTLPEGLRTHTQEPPAWGRRAPPAGCVAPRRARPLV